MLYRLFKLRTLIIELKMSEYKLVPVNRDLEIVKVKIPPDLIAYKSLDTPQLSINPMRCKKLLDYFSSMNLYRTEDGSLTYKDKNYPDIMFDEVVYGLADGRGKAPNGCKTVLDLMRRSKIPKTVVAKRFRKFL